MVFRLQNALQTPLDHVRASHSPTQAPNSRDSFVARWRITPVPLARHGDLADLADLRLPAEAKYLQALLHSPWSLRMTQASASGLNCSRERTLYEEVAAAGIFAFIRYRRVGARE
jgi:hypothetical protein